MIKNIQLIRNVGLFGSYAGSRDTEFAKLSLVYAENAKGKTTLSSILRSLGSGDPLPVAERKKLSSQDSPHIVIECDNPIGSAVFQNGSWNKTYPEIRVFDDQFVHENVYSGLEVSSDHRQNLHQLIIGKQGVNLRERVRPQKGTER